MMGPAFVDTDLAGRLEAAGERWLGTRYAHMGVARGDSPGKGGVDCTKLMGLILAEIGLIEEVEPSFYARDWFINGDTEVVLMAFTEHLVKHLRPGYGWVLMNWRRDIPLLLGDVICFAMRPRGLCNHTSMVWGDGGMLHAIEGPGVHLTAIDDHWKRRARFVYRILRKD